MVRRAAAALVALWSMGAPLSADAAAAAPASPLPAVPKQAFAPTQAFALEPGLSIGVQRLPALADAPARATPIYFIAGGPAVSPSEELARRPALFERLRRLGEVVLVEQRGAGSSQPSMDCDAHWALPLARVPTREEVVADARRQFAQCAAALRARGVRLEAYRTEAYAQDLQRVMQSLGHTRVRLLAHSYGSMLALELLRLDAPRIECAVLAGVMGPGDALRDPAHHERVLATLAADQGLDPARLRAQVATALQRIEAAPLLARTADGVPVRLGRDDIARGLVQSMGRPAQARSLPALIEALAEGRVPVPEGSAFDVPSAAPSPAPLPAASQAASQAAPAASGVAAGVAPTVPRSEALTSAWLREAAEGTRTARTGPLARRAAAQHYLTVCANGQTEAGQRSRSGTSLFGHQLHAALPAACDGWGLPLAPTRPPVVAAVPVMLISALLDVRTPHEQALAVQATLPRATLLSLAGAGHGEVLGPHAQLEAAISAFLRGEAVPAATLEPTR
jgi:pimeloyl-ACP methyl ester carboxylesterase